MIFPMTSYKKWKVNQIVETVVDLEDENHNPVPTGTHIRIVAIAPKVRIVSGENKDTLPYFYNAVLASQDSDWPNRIRENFCTIREIK